MKKYITRIDIDKMLQNNRIIIFIKNKVYDVTDFIHMHPAGKKCIEKHICCDTSVSYKFHSNKAQKLWKKFFIGHLIDL